MNAGSDTLVAYISHKHGLWFARGNKQIARSDVSDLAAIIKLLDKLKIDPSAEGFPWVERNRTDDGRYEVHIKIRKAVQHG